MPIPSHGTNQHLKNHVIKTLLYYDIFNYPLRVDEVYRFLGTNSIQLIDVKNTLEALVQEKKAFQQNDLYSIQNTDSHFERRLEGNQRADQFRPLVFSRAKLISRFPFVQAVMASGSYSKHVMMEDSDLDFFVVTSPNRVWIVRMMLAIFKRVVFLNSHKTFCCNYFVDTAHLEIEEKNIFTATEIATLVPLYCGEQYHHFLAKNAWIKQFFPNYKSRSIDDTLNHKPGWVRRFAEWILDGRLGDRIDAYFMDVNKRRLKRLYAKKTNKREFHISFKSNRAVSKNHPNQYQIKVVDKYLQKIEWFEKKYAMEFDSVETIL